MNPVHSGRNVEDLIAPRPGVHDCSVDLESPCCFPVSDAYPAHGRQGKIWGDHGVEEAREIRPPAPDALLCPNTAIGTLHSAVNSFRVWWWAKFTPPRCETGTFERDQFFLHLCPRQMTCLIAEELASPVIARGAGCL